jgi:hypothetical protein
MAWLKKVPTMLMGIDVTHPGPGSVKGTPSIAAVVASYEIEFAQYPASMEIQETKKEVLLSRSYLIIAYSIFVDGHKFGKDDLGAPDAVQAEEQVLTASGSCLSRWCL